MCHTFSHLERSAFRHGQYVGYGRNRTYRISRACRTDLFWQAIAQSGECTPDSLILARTLHELNEKLSSV
jgi:hypothetical protein